MGLNANQKKAVEYLSGPLLVLAGPGTGKTQLLSEKVAYILKNTDTNPENILCLTFTESGAKNMRERLKSIIGPEGMKVNIGTYHAFGQDILAQYKNYSTEYDRRLDAAIDEINQYKIIKNIQKEFPGNDILKGDSISDIIDIISEAKSAGLSADDLSLIAKQNIDDSNYLSKIISPYLNEVVPRNFTASFEKAYNPIYKFLKDFDTDKPILKGVEKIAIVVSRALKDAILDAGTKESISPLTKWRDDYFEKTSEGNYRLKDYVANKKLSSLAVVMAKYEAYLKENGLFDFDDMIEEAAKALREDSGFRMTLQERYQYIMLDEFQDTNPSQFAIVKELTDYESPSIMAVGDDDQAIYEFQGALSSNLLDFQQHYNSEVIPLIENYRSTQEILDFSHHIIEQAPDRFADKELIAHKNPPSSSQIHRLEFESSDAEFAFIAQKINELIKQGVRQNDIAIISYKSKYFEPLLPFLKSYDNIKIAYEKRDNLFEDEKMHQLFTLSRFIFELASETKPTVQIMEILSYPFFEVSLISVIKLINEAKINHKAAFDYLIENGDQNIKDVLNKLADFAGRSFTEPLSNLLFHFSNIMNLDRLSEYDRFHFYENLASLNGKLVRHFGDKHLRLGDLIEMLDDYESAGMPLNTTSPYRDADEAVQILTAHKAKGLEFEYVFIISADHTAWGKGKGNNNFLSLPKNLTHIRHTGLTDSEKLRVLYVALTRAKTNLYITNSIHDFNGKSPERLEYFEEYIEKTDAGEIIVSPFLPTRTVKQILSTTRINEREKNVLNWLTPYLAKSPSMRSFYEDKMKTFRMSASALTTFVDIIYSGPEAFFERYILGAPGESDAEQLVFGNLMHATFEKVTKSNLTNEEAIQFYLDELEKYDASPDTKKSLREKGPENILLSLERFGDIIRNGEAEVNFSSDKIVIDGIPISGKIDHFIIDEDAKTIEVYDYKTGSYYDGNLKSKPILFQYMLQLQFYKLLLNHSRKYHNYKVTAGHILFVTKDKYDDNVHDKRYNYNDQDFADFMDILKAVYKQATTLRFLDDDTLYLAADKSRNMRSVREYIELLLARSNLL